MIHVLFNPLSNNKKGALVESELKEIFRNKKIDFTDITNFQNVKDFCSKISASDELIIAGGDGTLTRFADDIYGTKTCKKVFLYPCGSGNDFFNDIKDKCKFINNLIPLGEYIKSLPDVYVNGVKHKFINGIGYGIDGYCCEEGDRVREKSDKKVNYAGIAIKGLLGKFHPSNATVTVDGEVHHFKHVWLAPSMLGRFYGGGMMIAPDQDRLNKEKTLTCVICHKACALKILMIFPKIFTGTHTKYPKIVSFMKGHDITVEFDKPQALQIDGETISNVSSYRAVYK